MQTLEFPQETRAVLSGTSRSSYSWGAALEAAPQRPLKHGKPFQPRGQTVTSRATAPSDSRGGGGGGEVRVHAVNVYARLRLLNDSSQRAV